MSSQESLPNAPQENLRGVLVCIGGLPGIGKTTVGLQLLEFYGNERALLIDPDIVRAEILGRKEEDGIREQDMAPAVTAKTIDLMVASAEAGLVEGKTVIVPSAFVLEDMRERFEALAAKRNVGFFGFWLDAPDTCLKTRLALREEHRKTGRHDATTVSAVTQLDRGLIVGAIRWPVIEASPAPEQIVRALLNTLLVGF